MSRLRVALLHTYRDEQQPSMRLYADRLGDALLRKGVSVARVQPDPIVPAPWRARSSLWDKLDTYLGRFAVYPRLARQPNADIVHVTDHGQGYLVRRLDPRRTIVTCHDVILLALASGRLGGSPVPPVALELFRISLECMKSAGMVVADSSQTKRDLVDFIHLDPNRITVVHPGLNQPFAPDPDGKDRHRRRFGFGPSRVILQIGRRFYKNVAAVIRVMHRLREQGLDVKVGRVGPRLNGEDRRLAERLGVIDHVIEIGSVPDADLPALYNAVDVLLFPSRYEGFGWPPLEAMASGTPVVCSRAGSLDEVVGDAALVADPEDIEALAWHTGTVLTDERLRSRLIERGLARASQFSWDRTAERMVHVYRDLLGAAG